MSTIVALSTPPGTGAIHVIRISGSETFEIINKISLDFVNKDENRIQLTYLKGRNSKLIDQVLLIKFYAPASYTGEDLIEINCHGNNLIVKLILEELVRNGAVYALKGEFTKRAFLNNKIDLNQALNINYLFQAKFENEVYSAIQEIKGESSEKIKKISDMLLSCISECEVNIDYPPEIENDEIRVRTNLNQNIKKIIEKIEELLDNSRNYKSSSFRVVLAGKPNSGKSSLINFLLKKDRIIVSEIAGTTRDVIEVEYFFEGFLLTLVDTAGINKNPEKLEYEGIKKTKDEIKKADLIFHLVSLENPEDKEDQDIKENLKNKNVIEIFTKSDLIDKNIPKNSISVKNSDINFFLSSMKKNFENSYTPLGIKSQEGINFLNNACEELKKSLDLNLSLDLVALNLSVALDFLSSLLSTSPDRINSIFDNFCVGK